jgi:hypothetical protein
MPSTGPGSAPDFITKMVDNADIQDKIITELEQYQDGDGSFGKEIARRQWRSRNFDPDLISFICNLIFHFFDPFSNL